MTTDVSLEDRERLFIGGAWQSSSGSDSIPIISPTSEHEIARVAAATPADVDRAVGAARETFDRGEWSGLAAAERAAVLRSMQAAYERRAEELAQVITREMGSPIGFSRAVQVGFTAWVLSYHAELAERYQFETVREGPAGDTIVRREPVGVVAVIVPWNYPQLLAMMKIAPALAAGSVVVLKPAPETALDGLLLGEIAEEAGLPPGVLNIVPGGGEVGEHLVKSAGIDKVAFTGSTAAGRRVGLLCGAAVKRATLELGGKSAAIVLDDADIENTIAALAPLAFVNAGQTCTAQTRVLAHRRRYREVVEALAAAAEALAVGDPLDEATELGPLVAERQRKRVEDYIAIGRQEGATIVCGGTRPADQARGWYVSPTVFADVDNRMRIAQEEIFGPVIGVIPYDDDDHAIRLANESDYGLSGSVWTADVNRGIAVARRVRTGQYIVNGAAGSPEAPFGGFKRSGIGREGGPEGLEAYLEIKSIAVPKRGAGG
jgi:betaine-aldehyde dehydrogenase